MKLNHPIIRAAIDGCIDSMALIKTRQLEGVPKSEMKKNETVVTATDRKSQAAAKNAFKGMKNVAFWAEEDKDQRFKGDGQYGLLIDGLDGTNAFTTGLITSTVIIGILDRHAGKIVGVVIGEPISGRIWACGDEGKPTLVYYHAVKSRRVKVWPGDLKGANVFIDVSHKFSHAGKQMLTDEQNAELYRNLQKHCKILLPGSNGLMHALVANGGERAAGSVTTAIGGAWDICGGLLVEQAGGHVIALIKEDGELCRVDYRESILDVDMLICANNKATANELLRALPMLGQV